MTYGYSKPKDLAEALELAGGGENRFFIAGGTDLMVKIKAGAVKPAHLIDIGRLPDLGGIEEKDGRIRIGAAVSHSQLWMSDVIRDKAYVLAEAAKSVGAVQIRNMGTIGGNVCNASPAGDTIPALQVLDAVVDLCSKAGPESMRLDDFLHLPAKTKIKPGQMVVAFSFKPMAPGEGAAFVKMGARRAMAISVVNGAAWLKIEGGKIAAARVAIGSVAVKTLRLPDVEKLLIGKAPSRELFAEAGAAGADAIKPIDDIRGTAGYRKTVAATVIERSLAGAAKRAGKGA